MSVKLYAYAENRTPSLMLSFEFLIPVVPYDTS